MRAALAVCVAVVVAATGCAGERNWRVRRVPAETVVDYDYRFDDEDARQVCQGMVRDALSKPWLDDWAEQRPGQRPLIVLGDIRNDTDDYINTHIITDRVLEEMLNSRRVRVKAARDLRPDLRQERLDTEYNDPATVKKIAMEANADFMMLGRIKDVKERTRDRRAVAAYYEVTLQLVDLESAEVVWIQTEELKKVATR